jgi:hypothetical protein
VWLHVLASISLSVAFACALILAIDVIRRPQPMAVMNVVWPITALYFGPIAVWWYWTLARSKEPLPFWKSIIVEATHCGAGCSLGDIIAEFGAFFLGFTVAGSTLFAEYVADYVLAFTFGVAFQYFAIVPMRNLSFFPGVKAAIQADAISLTAFEIGLFGWMYVMTRIPWHEHLTPLSPIFWMMMQIGMVVGFATSYPANWFLVRVGIKQPM